MLQLGPIGDWSDDAIVSKRRCRDGNLGKDASTMLSQLANKMLNQSASMSKQLAYAQSFATWPKSLHVWHSARGHMVALWPVSPHSSHIAVSIRGQSARLWPFGSSLPSQFVPCVQGTRSSKRFCESCCRMRCILFEYIRLLIVLMRRTCYTRNLHPLPFCRSPGSLHIVQ